MRSDLTLIWKTKTYHVLICFLLNLKSVTTPAHVSGDSVFWAFLMCFPKNQISQHINVIICIHLKELVPGIFRCMGVMCFDQGMGVVSFDQWTGASQIFCYSCYSCYSCCLVKAGVTLTFSSHWRNFSRKLKMTLFLSQCNYQILHFEDVHFLK